MARYSIADGFDTTKMHRGCQKSCAEALLSFIRVLSAVTHPSQLKREVNPDASWPLDQIDDKWILRAAGRSYRFTWNQKSHDLRLLDSHCDACLREAKVVTKVAGSRKGAE